MILKVASKIPNFDFQTAVASVIVTKEFLSLLADENAVRFKHQKKFKLMVIEKCKQIGVRVPIEWDFELEYSLRYSQRAKVEKEIQNMGGIKVPNWFDERTL